MNRAALTQAQLLATLQAIRARLIECAATPASAADAYDSYYGEMVDEAIAAAQEPK